MQLDSFSFDTYYQTEKQDDTTLIKIIKSEDFDSFYEQQSDFIKAQIDTNSFKAKAGQSLTLLSETGHIGHILAAFDENDLYGLVALASKLPKSISSVVFENLPQDFNAQVFSELWAHELYEFSHYKKSEKHIVKLVLDASVDQKALQDSVRATFFGRNAINLPAEECTPQKLQNIFDALGKQYDAKVNAIIGTDLLDQGMNLIHAVGRGVTEQERLPRLLHLSYNSETDYPHLALVGKGVTFDTGGLNLKPGGSMALMKKDMGGAAAVISLAMRLMASKLPIKLDLFVPTGENNVAGNSFRPGDIFTAYNGKTVQITNTDAEGRLLLADALAKASELNPDYIINMATLTGAARVALGNDLAPIFTHDDDMAHKICAIGEKQYDLIWRLPMYKPYLDAMKGTISDLVNSEAGSFAGASTAALFLSEFVSDTEKFAHFDIYGWNKSKKTARPEGGEVMATRSLYHYIKDEFLG